MLWATFLPVFLLCQAREIEELPGLTFNVGFKHYTGFLQVSKTHFLHYWFVESQNDSTKDPLIFWFNGGPGCSSLVGLLLEMGPYLVNADGRSLRPNLYSWNKLASIVYIESPVGVGYSYATDGNATTNDDQTSLENYEAMKQFLLVKFNFPELKETRAWESYAGIYVPTLAARIVDGQNEFNFNLKGIAIGNGYVSTKLNLVTMAKFAYGHGIIDETVWSEMGKLCCNGDAGSCDSSQVCR
ncbi:serine carboxypeptidase [Oesophagostomum dentatum]|uniref:Serine carboxypeptidase n=1 Tax=Oesophagostomum dentatum TaxID=61180 RepID=A0A0B1S3T3_OESDE|nr:serine carboxypeptidase [Oesophagostomum dentatum]